MAEALNSLFKAECIRNPVMRPRGGCWKNVGDVEIAVAEYIDWYNHRRLHGEIGHIPPAEYEQTTGTARSPTTTLRPRSSPRPEPTNRASTKLGAIHPASPAQHWGTLEPDRVGEYQVASVLLPTPALLPRLLDAASPGQIDRALTVLARTLVNPVLTAGQTAQLGGQLEQLLRHDLARYGPATIRAATQAARPDPVIDALQRATSDTDPDLLRTLAGALPYRSLVLAGLAATWATRMVDQARHHQEANPTDPAFTPDLASSLKNLSNRRADLGRREDALAAITEAVDLYRGLAADRPDAFTPDLASSLNNLSVQLAGLGRREDALAAITEAVDLYRGLAADRPDAFTPDLASSLNNLSVQLAGLGRREDALAAITEAVDLYRGLAADRSDAFTPDLASSLNNLSVQLGDLGRREDALAAITEAVDLRRGLAADRSDAFTPDLASSLNNLSLRLGDLGRREDALAAITEAVDLYRGLAAARPDAFTPDLATSLVNLGVRLTEARQFAAALVADREAARLYAHLAERWPDAFTDRAMNAARNLLIGLRDLGYDQASLQDELEAAVGADLARAALVSQDPVASAVQQWQPLITDAAAIAQRRADAETTAAVNDTLDDLAAQQDWAALIPVLRRIIDDPTSADLRGLDPIDTAIATELQQQAMAEQK